MQQTGWILFNCVLAVFASGALAGPASGPAHRTENVFFISVDGFRWQEVFTGAEEALMTRDNGVWDTNRLRSAFWAATPEARRRALLPFLWEVVASRGQIYGNGNQGSVDVVTNGKKFTYPGFNELLTGAPDDRINSNEKRNNPNVTVLEWLYRKPGFTNQVAAFVNWEVHPYILNASRSGIPVWSGGESRLGAPGSRLALVEDLNRDTTSLWGDMGFDSFFFHAAQEYLKQQQPRVVWVAFSETDEWAHEGNYEHYLHAAHNVDRYIRELWETVQSLPAYKDKTTFIITCDHGRGSGADWRNHGEKIDGAERVWLAVLGPDTRPLGERKNIPQITHSQVAATLAALLGEDYCAANPRAGAPISDLLPAGDGR
ncbi:MAG: alkaline phosphatase family protein [Verrucomicrobiota bacterium]